MFFRGLLQNGPWFFVSLVINIRQGPIIINLCVFNVCLPVRGLQWHGCHALLLIVEFLRLCCQVLSLILDHLRHGLELNPELICFRAEVWDLYSAIRICVMNPKCVRTWVLRLYCHRDDLTRSVIHALLLTIEAAKGQVVCVFVHFECGCCCLFYF